MSRMKVVHAVIAVCLMAGVAAGRVAASNADGYEQSSAPAQQAAQPPSQPAKQKTLVSVVGFENRAVYAADKLRDTSSQLLSAQLLRSGEFRVGVAWDQVKTIFDYNTLGTSDIVKTPEGRQKAAKLLLCDYFISGAITRFDVKEQRKNSALKNTKEFQTTVRVDLMIQDPRSGEHIAQGTGEATTVSTVTGTITGGQSGTWDPTAGSEALDKAIAQALAELVKQFQQFNRR
jgi:curli biogenesis system outer membrane secretion channel CsgG